MRVDAVGHSHKPFSSRSILRTKAPWKAPASSLFTSACIRAYCLDLRMYSHSVTPLFFRPPIGPDPQLVHSIGRPAHMLPGQLTGLSQLLALILPKMHSMDLNKRMQHNAATQHDCDRLDQNSGCCQVKSCEAVHHLYHERHRDSNCVTMYFA